MVMLCFLAIGLLFILLILEVKQNQKHFIWHKSYILYV